VRIAGRLVAILLLAIALVGLAPAVRADVVDDAFAEGNERAEAGDWDGAIAAWQRARGLLGQPSSVLSYNLGTAHAERGDHGRATFHLRQALDFRGSPTAELAEAARYNLAIVRRRAELQAATTGALVDRPQTWWDLLVETLRAPGVGWTALLCGVLWLVVLIEHVRRARRGRSLGVTRALAIAFGSLWLVAGVLHGVSLRADRTAPRAIVLDMRVDAREGPGTHRKVEFAIQGGAQVRIVDRTPGWVRAQLPGGVEGWVPESAVGELESTASVRPLPGPTAAGPERDTPASVDAS